MHGTVAGEVERGVQWVAQSRAMRVLLEQAQQAARLQSPVMIVGEAGSGKSTLAEYLHVRSGRGRRAFVRYRPISQHASLVRQALFGSENGPGGLVEQSDTGTLYVEEITRLPVEVQPELLQVLERSTVRTGVRAPSLAREMPVDVRLVTSTVQSPEEALRERWLGADLYVQLTAIRLAMPALRERREDIPELSALFVQQICKRLGRPVMAIEAEAIGWLVANPWPGNVRELSGVLEQAIALAPVSSKTIRLEDLTISAFVAPPEHDFLDRAVVRQLTIREVEDEYIARVVRSCGEDRVEAARRLGITRRTLARRLGEWL